MTWPGNGTLIATCGGGAEEALEREIVAVGLESSGRSNGTVRFRGRLAEAVLANLALRTASRVLIPLCEGAVRSYDDLYRLAHRAPWKMLVPPSLTVAVSAVGRSRSLTDTRLAALKVKDAIVDAQRSGGSRRSSVDRRRPDVPVSVFVANDRAVISLDTSGAPLHVRGYRTEGGEAPLRETVAAAMLAYSGWTPGAPLLDPFCGSGTVAIEAALHAAGILPGALREGFAFERWPWISAEAVARARSRAAAPPDVTTPIVARDVDPGVVEMATRNAERAGVADRITFETADAHSAEPPDVPAGYIVTNPPYGERLDIGEASPFYAAFGDRLKRSYPGWTAAILSANRDAMKSIGLRVSSRTQLWNGGLDARLYRIVLYRNPSDRPCIAPPFRR
ncbi:MAG: THUMP domain-containing class I SAM-dependent RNA methyltransferase [Spirochaetota bacterium]